MNDTLKKIKSGIDLSIVVPIYNERESIEKLYKKLDEALSRMNLKYEVLLIDDGSVDDTFNELLKVHRKNKLFKIIRFRKNFGQTSAISAGFSYAEGEVVVTLDADLQNDPRDIPVLLEKLNEGYDIVSGWRRNRKDKAVLSLIHI